jgi:putative ATP-dependent endonuclease of the OLD family
MRISYVHIENFRNFRSCEVELGQNVILIGENKAGKSNFIEALRLVLDPSLSDLDRQLESHDFWDGDDPFKGREIKITIRLTDFAKEPDPDFLALSLLCDHCIVETQPEPVAQVTYWFFNAKKTDAPLVSGPEHYEFKIYPGNNTDKAFNIRELRKHVPLQVIGALRDIAGDNRVWRRSPLSRLVELSDLKVEELEPLAEEVHQVSDKVMQLKPLSTLQGEIKARLEQMVGALYSIDPELGLSATTASGLEEALRLYIDGDRHRTLDRASLGLQNALYLALLSLLVEKQVVKRTAQKERFIPIIALEEPEAHLHPHLQRLVFNDFLVRARQRRQPVIVSTHSPHLASVANLEDLVLLKDWGVNGCQARSACSFAGTLEERARRDLDRFLDITKSEMLFAKGVVFVEGDVELLLVGEFARIMGTPLDRYGISVCNVSGVQFGHVATLARKFGIPFVILTDGDKKCTVTGLCRGIELVRSVAGQSVSLRLDEHYKAGSFELVRRYLRLWGIFVNQWTFEASLLESGLGPILKSVFLELGDEIDVKVKAGCNWVDACISDASDTNVSGFLNSVADARWGKGRFAHRLLRHIRAQADDLTLQEERTSMVPEYIQQGINCLISAVESERTAV